MSLRKSRILHRFGILQIMWKYFTYRNMRRKVRYNLRQVEEEIGGDFNQHMAIEIVKTQARKNHSYLTFAPISEQYIIRTGDQDIILSMNNIAIVNGKYHYDVKIGTNTTNYLAEYVKKIIERRKQNLILEIESKIKRSLKTIYDQTQGPPLLEENFNKMSDEDGNRASSS